MGRRDLIVKAAIVGLKSVSRDLKEIGEALSVKEEERPECRCDKP